MGEGGSVVVALSCLLYFLAFSLIPSLPIQSQRVVTTSPSPPCNAPSLSSLKLKIHISSSISPWMTLQQRGSPSCAPISPPPPPIPLIPPVSGFVCSFPSDAETQVSDNKNQNLQNDCVFCKIVRGESPAWKLYEDDTCLCILDIYPLSHGHSLIIPKSHFPSLDATPPSVVAAMCSKVPFISNAIMKATGSDSFNLLINNGEAAGQVIFHTHIHIIPRKAYDCLWASESLLRRPLKLDDKVSQLAARIQEELPSEILPRQQE